MHCIFLTFKENNHKKLFISEGIYSYHSYYKTYKTEHNIVSNLLLNTFLFSNLG